MSAAEIDENLGNEHIDACACLRAELLCQFAVKQHRFGVLCIPELCYFFLENVHSLSIQLLGPSPECVLKPINFVLYWALMPSTVWHS